MSNEWDEFVAKHNAECDKKRRKRPSDEEHQIQVACVRWFRYQYPKLAKRLFAVPNGGRRDETTAAKLKAEGVVAGVADLILFKPRQGYGALCIEMKTAKGTQSPSQKEWQKDVTTDKEYKYVMCRSLDDFMTAVNNYLILKVDNNG